MLRLRRLSPALALLVLAATAAGAASRPAVRGPRGMVVAPEAAAAAVGRAALDRGGNAVDAAVATALALAVTFPRAGNLGGGGFLLYREPGGAAHALDFRETAPGALRPEMFRDAGGRPVPRRSLDTGLAVGIPGSPAGLHEAHRRWGRLPWKEVVAPAIRLARDGWTVTRRTAATLRDADGLRLGAHPASAAIFTRGGEPLREGDRLVQPDLARTLRRLAADGPQGFYRGPVAEAVVQAVAATGGVMTREDLAAYRPVLREPLAGSYRGRRVLTFPPPSAGGVAVLQILGMLERFDLAAAGPGSSRSVHLVAEASRRAFADRARWVGDPAFVEVPLAGLLSPAYVAERSAGISEDRVSSAEAGAPAAPEGAHTLHLSTADEAGGAVAMTTTLNSWYGSAIVAGGTGVLLNNEIDDFALGAPNQFGLSGGDVVNALRPGARPVSSMSPTIVEAPGGGPRPALVLGSPGGPTIVSSVVETIVNVVDFGLPLQAAVDAPRFHHQGHPDRLDHEPGAFPRDVAEALARRGHALHEREPIGNVAAIGRDADGAWLGAADPRDEGAAEGR